MKITSILIILFFCELTICGCLNQKNNHKGVRERNIKYDSSKKTSLQFIKKKHNDSLIKFSELSNTQIISMHKMYDRGSSTEDSTASTMKEYRNWILKESDILNILMYSKPITGTELDLSYVTLPFWYKGELLINSHKATYKINAGSFTILKFEDTAIYLGYPFRNHKYFLVPADTVDDR